MMKKSELRKIIKEEIDKMLSEVKKYSSVLVLDIGMRSYSPEEITVPEGKYRVISQDNKKLRLVTPFQGKVKKYYDISMRELGWAIKSGIARVK